jgi:protein-tyrosine phosphatase
MRPLVHPTLPPGGRIWGAARPGYPAEPPLPRDVEAGVREWVGRGIDTVVNLMEDAELPRRAPGLLAALHRHELAVLRYPIVDFGAPADTAAFEALLADVHRRLARGATVLVHCNAGLGRTAVFLGTLLRSCGFAGDPVAEIRRIYQPGAMENPVQEAFVRGFAVPPPPGR